MTNGNLNTLKLKVGFIIKHTLAMSLVVKRSIEVHFISIQKIDKFSLHTVSPLLGCLGIIAKKWSLTQYGNPFVLKSDISGLGSLSSNKFTSTATVVNWPSIVLGCLHHSARFSIER